MKVLLIYFLLIHSAFAESNTFLDRIRPYIEKVLGRETTNKILGRMDKEIELPAIPEVKANATSTEIYEARGVEIKIPKEQRQKYNFLFIKEIYRVTINEVPDENTIENWMSALKQGASREGIYRSLVLDGKYRELERFENPPEQELIDFTLGYMSKYLNLEAKKQQLGSLNAYSLKRIVVEKTLEVMDAFGTEQEKLANWYAVLSSDLAENYANLWKGKIRGQVSKQKHKNWALHVPNQHLKSEVIIKLHTVFNQFI